MENYLSNNLLPIIISCFIDKYETRNNDRLEIDRQFPSFVCRTMAIDRWYIDGISMDIIDGNASTDRGVTTHRPRESRHLDR